MRSLHRTGLLRQTLNVRSSTRTPTLQLQLPSTIQARNLQTTTRRYTESHENDVNVRLGKRDVLNPSRSEGTQTGTDDEVASQGSSFDPSNTAPESEVAAAGKESAERHKTSNPLDVSAGNREVNATRDPSQDPPGSGVERPQSTRGWSPKNKPVNQEKR